MAATEAHAAEVAATDGGRVLSLAAQAAPAALAAALGGSGTGGPGCCALCAGTEFFDEMQVRQNAYFGTTFSTE
jgi:hypothetical protein